MQLASEIPILTAVVLSATLIYFAARVYIKKRGEEAEGEDAGFQPSIGFTRQDGFQSVALLLLNESDVAVWAEEIEIALTNLHADHQTSEASCHGIHKIRQSVLPGDVLPISLVEAIYNAAGKPQRKYSCVLSSLVRYRAGDKWFEKPMRTYELRMAGLTVASMRRDRKTAHQFQHRVQPPKMSEEPQFGGQGLEVSPDRIGPRKISRDL